MQIFRGVKRSSDLVARLRRAVADGSLAEGTRLPSQRRLAYDLGIAVGTVTSAYQVAEREGLIVSYVGRGSFVARPGGRGIRFVPDRQRIDLSNDRPLETLNPALAGILRTVAAEIGAEALLDYPESPGCLRHRAGGVRWLSRFGVTASADDVVVCAGSQHAIFCSLAAVCHPGDRILAEELSFHGFRSAAGMLGLQIEAMPVDAHGIVPDAVEEACRTLSPRLLYFTPSVQNPTNAPLNAARRQSLARLAEKYDLALVEDVIRPGTAPLLPAPVYSLAPDRTFFIGGVSKTLGGGLRVSYLAVPRRWREAVVDAVWASLNMVPPLMAEIVTRLIENGAVDRVIEAKNREAARRRALVERRLGDFDVRTHPSSTVAWLVLPDTWTNAAAVTEIAKQGVAVVPADAFWNGRTPPPDALRLCFGAPKTADTLDTALARIAETLRQKSVRFVV